MINKHKYTNLCGTPYASSWTPESKVELTSN